MSRIDDILGGLPGPMQKDTAERVLSLALNRALDRAHRELSEDKQRAFDELSVKETLTQAEAETFLRTHVPNFNAILLEEAVKLRGEIEQKLTA